MEYTNPDALVSTQWLADHVEDPMVRIVDATWYPVFSGNDGIDAYEVRHIPGAVFWDAEDITDLNTNLPHMTPDDEEFIESMSQLGISNEHRVIVYDAQGGHSVALRAWWMLRLFGHANVALLDGGLQRWIREKRPLSDVNPRFSETTFDITHNNAMVRDVSQMLANLHSKAEQIVDMRAAKQFSGEEPDPYAVELAHMLKRETEPQRGHIPGARNLQLSALLDPQKDYTVRPADDLIKAFVDAGIDVSRPITAMCGAGSVAAVVPFALHLLGYDIGAIYEGSWSEWANFDGTPAEFGAN